MLGKHQYKGKDYGKFSRFRSKLTTPRERAQMKKMPLVMKQIELEGKGYEVHQMVVHKEKGKRKMKRIIIRSK